MHLASPLTIEEEYSKTYEFLCSLERFGILLGLENITQLLDVIGNPQKSFPVVHVAGSNGKGSTSSFVTSALIEAGLETALYTSPHLNDFRERIRIDGSMVSMEEVILSTRKIREAYDPERTTFFEFTTAVAFDCMARAKPDIGVIEVGLGGRLDATNTVEPSVTVITDISREHEDYLGEGIASVAREKAGIIKQSVPLVTGASRTEARRVILERARDLNAPVREFGKDFLGKRTSADTFTYRSPDLTLENLYLGMAGGHQIKNGSLACAVLEELRKIGYRIPDRAITEGLRKTVFPGRFERVRTGPDVIIDGAHTPESMRLLKSTLKRYYPGVKPFMLLGMLKEKNYEEMIRILVPMAREVVCVEPQGDRAMDPEDLAAIVRRHGAVAEVAENIVAGLRLLEQRANENDVILAAGSLYMIGPVRRACGLPDV